MQAEQIIQLLPPSYALQRTLRKRFHAFNLAFGPPSPHQAHPPATQQPRLAARRLPACARLLMIVKRVAFYVFFVHGVRFEKTRKCFKNMYIYYVLIIYFKTFP